MKPTQAEGEGLDLPGCLVGAGLIIGILSGCANSLTPGGLRKPVLGCQCPGGLEERGQALLDCRPEMMPGPIIGWVVDLQIGGPGLHGLNEGTLHFLGMFHTGFIGQPSEFGEQCGWNGVGAFNHVLDLGLVSHKGPDPEADGISLQ